MARSPETRASGKRALALTLALWACDSETLVFEASDGLHRRPDGRFELGFAPQSPTTGLEIPQLDGSVTTGDLTRLTDAGYCQPGLVVGITCAPNGRTVVPLATISAQTRDCFGHEVVVSTTSDERGRFTLRGLSPGPVTLEVRSGSFVGRYRVTVPPDGQVTLDDQNGKLCLAPDATRLAVITGQFDRIEDVLARLGFEHESACGHAVYDRPARRLLTDLPTLALTDVLFVNCGTHLNLRADNVEHRQMLENLRAFVRGGGSLYVSDLAAGLLNVLYPAFVTFDGTSFPSADAPVSTCCACGDCPPECIERPRPISGVCAGTSDQSVACTAPNPSFIGRGRVGAVEAVIHDAQLRAHVGSASVLIRYNLAGWVGITDTSDGVEVLVSGAPGSSQVNRPLVVRFAPEGSQGGRVVYTTFHNHDQPDLTIDPLMEAIVLRL